MNGHARVSSALFVNIYQFDCRLAQSWSLEDLRRYQKFLPHKINISKLHYI